MPNKLRYLVYLLRIRRIEFRIAEIPILLVPIILLVHDTAIFRSFTFWEGIFVFFLLFAFGDMINCLADRDLDAVYKPHLSEAVYGLGVPLVKFQVAATALSALLLTAHLALQLHRWELFGLVAIGLALGAGYSVKPIQFKGRGLAQVFCLWLIIFVGPMVFISLLVSRSPSLEIILLAAAFGALQMGIILVNTAEDYPEDLEARIKTTIVALGLRRGIGLAFWLTAAGAIGLIGVLGFMFQHRSIALVWLPALLPAMLTYIYVLVDIGKLRNFIGKQDLPDAIATVKRAARKVPLWLTAVAWSTVIACFAFFIAGKQ